MLATTASRYCIVMREMHIRDATKLMSAMESARLLKAMIEGRVKAGVLWLVGKLDRGSLHYCGLALASTISTDKP